MKTISTLLFFFTFLTGLSFGQDSLHPKNSFFVEPILNAGKLFKNSPVFPETDFCLLNELSLGWQTNGNKHWHHLYGFPQMGISVVYAYQGNDVILGRTYAVMPNMSFHTLRNEKHHVEIRLGSGFAYFPVIHHLYDNPTNMFIGSHLNAIASFSLTYNTKLSDKVQFKFGASSFHFSNGHYQLPNAGLNSVVFTAGLKYFPGCINNLCTRKKTGKEKFPLLFNVRAGAGLHDFGVGTEIGRPKYMVYAASVFASKRFGKLSNVHAGITNKYYTNYYQFICDSNVYSTNRHLKSNAFSIFLGHEFMCGRLSLLTQGGLNLYHPFAEYFSRYQEKDVHTFLETWFWSRMGFQYYFFTPSAERRFNIYTGIFINANFGQADFDEISMGISF